jgi:hypothetical protein
MIRVEQRSWDFFYLGWQAFLKSQAFLIRRLWVVTSLIWDVYLYSCHNYPCLCLNLSSFVYAYNLTFLTHNFASGLLFFTGSNFHFEYPLVSISRPLLDKSLRALFLAFITRWQLDVIMHFPEIYFWLQYVISRSRNIRTQSLNDGIVLFLIALIVLYKLGYCFSIHHQIHLCNALFNKL